jgi:predicted transcriptional regulator
MKLSNKSNARSLLGIPDRQDIAARMAMQQDEELMQKHNDKNLDELAKKVSAIKKVSMDIEIGITESSRIADGLVSSNIFW